MKINNLLIVSLLVIGFLTHCTTMKKMAGKIVGTSFLSLEETIEESMIRPAIYENDIYWEGKKVGTAQFLAAAKGFASLKDAFDEDKRKLTQIYEVVTFKTFPQTLNVVSVPSCNKLEKPHEDRSRFFQGIAASDLAGIQKFTIGEISKPISASCKDCTTDADRKRGETKECARVEKEYFTIFFNFEKNNVILQERETNIGSISKGMNYEERWAEVARDWKTWDGKPAIEMLKSNIKAASKPAK
jgi:hypothetical protein